MTYRPPWSYRPPLAYGGHMWSLHDGWAQCSRCYVPVPRWAVDESRWQVLAGRWCTRMIRALPAGGGQLRLPGVP